MTAQFQQSSAKIYQFPRKVAAGVAARRRDDRAAELTAQRAPDIDFGGAWYHQAAVKDAEATPKP